MDIEQLKLILTTVSSMGDSGREMFIWWLMASKIIPLVLGLIWTLIGGTTVIFAYRIVKGLSASEKLMRAAKVNYSWGVSELEHACKILREDKDKNE